MPGSATADAGLGPGRERRRREPRRPARPDRRLVHASAARSKPGRSQIFSGATVSLLRTITSTTANEQLGFDAVGIGDMNRDGVPDELLSAATGDHVYIVARATSRREP